jgi:hypothetical protein
MIWLVFRLRSAAGRRQPNGAPAAPWVPDAKPLAISKPNRVLGHLRPLWSAPGTPEPAGRIDDSWYVMPRPWDKQEARKGGEATMKTFGAMAMLAAALAYGVAFTGCSSEPREPTEWKASEELPEGFSKDVPIYPQAKVVKSVTGDATVVVLRTSDPLKSVEEFYNRQLSEGGWAVRKALGVPAGWMGLGGVTLNARKAGRSLNLALGEKDDETVITAILRKG